VRLSHFYHVFADGDWEIPATEHFEELRVSGLLDELDGIYLGVVGSRENRRKVKRALRHHVAVEAVEGWEQVTLNKLRDFCQTDDGLVLYAHTKGAWSQSELARVWRVSMTHDVVTRWRECVYALEKVQCAGPFWLKSWEPEHADHESFFAGNFWWARSDYVRTLEPVGLENRFQAEGWVGLGKPSVKIMREGYSYWGNFWEPKAGQ
jgi:hypothetical protein